MDRMVSGPATEVALITGGASGIGHAAALTLGQRGARVAILDLNEAALSETADQLTAAGIEVIPVRTDITSQASVEAAVAQAVEAWGRIDTVVASAGVAYEGTVETTPLSDFQFVLDVALVGTFITAKATIPHLRESHGTFTAISSTTGHNGSSNWAAYSAAKHGVVGLVKCMALDHGQHGVRCNTVLPGFIQTPMSAPSLEGLSDAEIAATDNAIPLGRRAEPSEVASVIAHLTSPEASYVTGMNYVVDGGTLAGFYEPPSI